MYSYIKNIACFANSRKTSGRCIAGKVYENGNFGDWIRPVSSRPDEEISEDDRQYQSGDYANLLDIVSVPILRPVPEGFQTENHLIDDGYYWTREGTLAWNQLADAVDHVHALWINGYSSYNGQNDRVPERMAEEIEGSLFFLGPTSLHLNVSAEGAAFGNNKRTVRAFFRHNQTQYGIKVTDPVIEIAFLRRADGRYRLDSTFVCVSLAKGWNGFCYKVAAAIITPERTSGYDSDCLYDRTLKPSHRGFHQAAEAQLG
jgi:hypothetical protein